MHEILRRKREYWENERIERELGGKKVERLSIAREKQEKIRLKGESKKNKKIIEQGLKKLPTMIRNEMIEDEKKKEKLELLEIKKILWKLRKKQKKTKKNMRD